MANPQIFLQLSQHPPPNLCRELHALLALSYAEVRLMIIIGAGATGADFSIWTFAVSDPAESMVMPSLGEEEVGPTESETGPSPKATLPGLNMIDSCCEAVQVMRRRARMSSFIQKIICQIYDMINLRLPDFQLNVIRQIYRQSQTTKNCIFITKDCTLKDVSKNYSQLAQILLPFC